MGSIALAESCLITSVSLSVGCWSVPVAEGKMLKFCTLSILLCLFIPAHGTVPGTIVRVKQEALQYGKKNFLLPAARPE